MTRTARIPNTVIRDEHGNLAPQRDRRFVPLSVFCQYVPCCQETARTLLLEKQIPSRALMRRGKVAPRTYVCPAVYFEWLTSAGAALRMVSA